LNEQGGRARNRGSRQICYRRIADRQDPAQMADRLGGSLRLAASV
jgi:hypothetical protein